ncbi:MAG: hypothetical protein JJW00_02615 [Sulfurimonas sp.]|nr:hypothetical protein [Sulfurimonas sp.]
MTDTKKIKEQAKEIEELKKLLDLVKEDKPKAFSSVDMKYLRELEIINKEFNQGYQFDIWFKNNIIVSNDVEIFLQKLLDKYGDLINKFNEDTLKVVFIGSILERVNFLDRELKIGNYYHKNLTYTNDKIDFNGYCDFYVAKGLDYPEAPYFFIQEYKPSQGGGDPEPQLLAELICAVELNKFEEMKGAYVVGATWNFVILKKLAKDKYQYFVSRDFLSTRIDDLKDIYKNLLFVKDEIVEMVQKEHQPE